MFASDGQQLLSLGLMPLHVFISVLTSRRKHTHRRRLTLKLWASHRLRNQTPAFPLLFRQINAKKTKNQQHKRNILNAIKVGTRPQICHRSVCQPNEASLQRFLSFHGRCCRGRKSPPFRTERWITSKKQQSSMKQSAHEWMGTSVHVLFSQRGWWRVISRY